MLVPPSSRSAKKSFEDVLNSMEKMPEPTMLDGKPGIRFPAKVISSWAEPFKFVLVGKISGNRSLVPNSAINASITKMGLCRSFDLKFLPRGFLVLALSCEEDYTRFWAKGIMQIGPLVVRFSKWTPEFNLQGESPIAPVWDRGSLFICLIRNVFLP